MRTLLPARRPGSKASFSERAVERITQAVAPSKVDRRGFLYRAAITGTAIAVNPFDFAFKPGTAYASVCGQGSSCSSGWTAFCCTINKGANMCPTGSYVAGWWRIDDSAFCRGSARYIIDCNRSPNASCSCRCATGDCDKRRVCCNNFRYGQCNQQIKGVTEVVCRVVTCSAPWQWDPSCTRTVRVDNRTATHSSSCLPGHNPSHIEMKYQDLGLSGAAVGTPSGGERSGANGGRIRKYTNGYITYRAAVGAWSVHGPATTAAYERAGLEGGVLRYATADRRAVGDGRGLIARFERGVIVHTSQTGARRVSGSFWAAYNALSGPRGRLGYPTGEPIARHDGRGLFQRFENGGIYYTKETGARAVVGSFFAALLRVGGASGMIGYPRGNEVDAPGGGRSQRFEQGAIYRTVATGSHAVAQSFNGRYVATGATTGPLGYPRGGRQDVSGGVGQQQLFQGGALYATRGVRPWEVVGPWYQRYGQYGGPTGPMGFPTTPRTPVGDGIGTFQRFQTGRMFYSPGNGTRALHGAIDERYESEGGPRGWLGYPTTSLSTLSNGHQRVWFENGRITHDPKTGATTVERR